MSRLSSPLEQIADSYDAIVVGSGYGGAVAACRLATAGQRVCVLERGREIRPGEYPNDTVSMAKETQIDLPAGRVGSGTALFDFRVYDDLNVAMGCGLGLCLQPDSRVFGDRRWPAELREPAAMDRYFKRAEAMLKPAVYPAGRGPLAKLEAIERSARGLQLPVSRVPMAVNFEPLPGGVNHAGEQQQACVGCGDCISGCNYAAKNTLLMNYLPLAKRNGAEIFTGARVTRLEKAGAGWRVCFQTVLPDGIHFSEDTRSVRAATVVLGAGSLGSTELLLRSRTSGLQLSAALGHRFSGNGDMVGLIYNADIPVNGIGLGKRPPDPRNPVGACSTGLIDGRAGVPLEDGYIMLDGAIPGALGKWLPYVFGTLGALTGRDTDGGVWDHVQERVRVWQSKLFGPYAGAVKHTQSCLMVTHDDANGEMRLEGDRLVLNWPGVGGQRPFARADEAMHAAARAVGGTYVPNPVWHALLGRKLITGHPLGGCVMADDARDGVVNHLGQVYRGPSGTAVHEGLYVLDGAVVPRSLGVNPLLVITALAERTAALDFEQCESARASK